MPLKRIYSIRDKKLDQFGSLCFFENDAVATRAFGDLVTRDEQSMIHQHPSDFALVFIGFFNPENGQLSVPDGGVVVVCDADSFGK